MKHLVASATCDEVTERIAAMPADEWLDVLSWSGWESFCLGYLILRERFVPAGLNVGRTLPDFDIVGRARDGTRIVAQCKKEPHAIGVPDGFTNAVRELAPPFTAYLFAFNGCHERTENIIVVDRKDIERWVQMDPEGAWYLRMFSGKDS